MFILFGFVSGAESLLVCFMKMVVNWFVERGEEMEVKQWKTRGGLRGGEMDRGWGGG